MLQLTYDVVLISSFGFNFNLRRCVEGSRGGFHDARALVLGALFYAWVKVGGCQGFYTRPLLGLT